MWCVITYSLSRVLNYVLIGHTVWISDVGEKDQDFIMMLLTLSRIALCLPEVVLITYGDLELCM